MKFISAFKAERCVTQLLAEPDANTPTAQKALENLKNCGAGAIPVMVDALANADRYQTIGIVDALAALTSNQTFKEIANGLTHPNERCVAGVSWALSTSKNYDPNKLPDILMQEDISTHAVLDAMRSHLDRLNIKKLLNIAYQLEPREKSAVFKMIGKKATEDLVPDLLARTAGRDHSARVHIIEILSNFSLPEVQHKLEELLKDSNRQVRSAALTAIGEIDGELNIELIASLLLDGDLDVQSKAVDLLIKMRHPDTCKYLVRVLEDESEYTRRSAVEVLNEIADPSSIKDLLVAIGDSDWWVRSRACDALASIGGPRVLQAILKLIGDKDEDIRRSAIEILNQTKDEQAVAHLITATRDADWWVSERAVDALAEIGNKDAIPRLLEMLDGNPKAIPTVLKALGRIGDPSVVPKIVTMFQRPDPSIIAEAIGALTALVSESNLDEVRAQIQPLLKVGNDAVATSARDAMERINNQYTESAMVQAQKAERMAEPAHTMLIEDVDMDQLAQQAAAAAPTHAAQLDISALRTGDVIEGRYSYIEKIGKGAFGTVILVEDTVVGERLILNS